MSVRARSVSPDCLVAVVSGDDREAGPVCGPKCQAGRGMFETSEISGARRSGRGTPRHSIGRCCLLREVLMKNYRNIDIWLDRACHLTVVTLSVAAAFLLRFDFTIPSIVGPILKQAVLIAILVKLPIFDWLGLYRSLRQFVS